MEQALTVYPTTHVSIATRLADEGVPVRAIARATKIPSEDLREILEEAVSSGQLITIPRDDWPFQVDRRDRSPQLNNHAVEDDILLLNVVRLFRVTKQQASLLLVLIKRREVTRKQLHVVIESRRPQPKVETDQKIVDVVICKLRKRLKAHNINISTVWSCGYLMPPEDRRKAISMLDRFMETSGSVKVDEQIEGSDVRVDG